MEALGRRLGWLSQAVGALTFGYCQLGTFAGQV